ncbi:hypothetical protein OEZ85_004649 [Tetradesmus obliquus]|uniref:Uncharacterized protein n=1 Tax=Tetradesmus obliquus TaxID=3088 RepID=A0ABY8UM25_TETOB|nr:hypothetical protein OEZ85_004649 [Tetradesmus obliquus]
MVMVLLACVLAAQARPMNKFTVRGLLGVDLSPEQMMANNQRAQATTAQSIEEAVNAGANPRLTARAGRVGSFMSWASASAASNPSAGAGQATFDMAERLAPYLP